MACRQPFCQGFHRHIVSPHALTELQPPSAADFKISAREFHALRRRNDVVTAFKQCAWGCAAGQQRPGNEHKYKGHEKQKAAQTKTRSHPSSKSFAFFGASASSPSGLLLFSTVSTLNNRPDLI